jgi:hypothetical protein
VSSRRDQRGVVFPSPVVILSIVAVGMAGVAFWFTQGSTAPDHVVTQASQQQDAKPSPSASSSSSSPSGSPSASATRRPKPHRAKVDRSKVSVVVFNNSRVTGLAGQVAAKADQIGWQVVGSDNWYGTIPATTVYYPPTLTRAAKLLALDLGIERTAPAVDPMKMDRLTVILTGPLS